MIEAEGMSELIIQEVVRAQEKEQDSNFLIVGKEGIGKSTLMLDFVEYIDKLKGYITPIEYIARDISEFVMALSDSPREAVVCLDEGRKLSSLRTLETFSKDLTDAFTVMRKKKLITLICFTNPLKIQSYYKEDRTLGMFLIPRRGIVYFYRKIQLDQIAKDLVKVRSIKEMINNYKPSFKDTFPDYKGRLKESYERRKDEGIDNTLSELREKYSTKEKIYGLNAAAKYIVMGVSQLRQYVDKGLIKYTTNAIGTHYKFKESDLNKFREYIINTRKDKKKYIVTDTEYAASEKKSEAEE